MPSLAVPYLMLKLMSLAFRGGCITGVVLSLDLQAVKREILHAQMIKS